MVDGKLGLIITAFIMALVGIALLGSIADGTTANTSLTTVGSENITADLIAVRLVGNSVDPDVDITLDNSFVRSIVNVTINSTVLTAGTDYDTTNSNTGLILRFINTTTTAGNSSSFTNESAVTYTFNELYITGSSSRTLINLIPLFYVIGLLLLIIGGLFFKDEIAGLFSKK